MNADLANLVVARSTLPRSSDHGEQHWKAVAWAGLQLVPHVDGCDAELVLLFALVHDSQRHSEYGDPEHGLRAGEFARLLCSEGHVDLDDARLGLLVDACTRHDKGEVSDDSTIGVCWDSDRPNLWRVGIIPDPTLLSSAPARDSALIDEAASFHGLDYRWDDLFAAYGLHISQAAPAVQERQWTTTRS